MSLTKRTGSNLMWISLSDIFTKGTILFVTIYLARVLGVDNFGLFSLGVAIANTIWPIVDLGASGYGTREIARNHNNAKQLLPTLNTMRFIVSLIIIACTAIILTVVGTPSIKFWIIIYSMAYLSSFSLCPDWAIRGMEEMPLLFIINLTTSLFFILGIVIAIHNSQDAENASLLRSLSFLVGSFVGLILIYKKRGVLFYFDINISKWFYLLKNTYVFLINRIAANLIQFLPFFYITFTLSDSESGLFAAPHRLYIIGVAGIAAISSAIYPILSDVYKNDHNKFSAYQIRLVQYLLYLLIPFSLIGFYGSSDIIYILFGTDYSDSSLSLAIMLAAIPMTAIRSIYMITLMSGGLEKYSIWAILIAIVIQAITALILIPKMGIAGSALAILSGEVISAVILYIVCNRYLSTASIFNKNNNLLVLTTFFLIFLGNTFNWDLLLSIIFSVPIYIVLAHYLKILSISRIILATRAAINNKTTN